jgi:hypothetical protein
MMRRVTYQLLTCLLLGLALQSVAYAQAEPRRGTLDSVYWQELVEELEYEGIEEVEEEVETEVVKDSSNFWGPAFKALAIILAILILVVIFRQMLSDNPLWSPGNRKFSKDGIKVTLDNIEEHLERADLQSFIKKATHQGDYTQAIRLYYLAIIKALSEQSIIQWKKDKTNQDYQRELEGGDYAQRFAEATRHFERVWYGKYLIDQPTFERLQPFFKDFHQQIQQAQSTTS